MIYIGIDCGVHTGIAVWDTKERKFLQVDTMMIHQAMKLVESYCSDNLCVVFEDARLRKWYTGDVNAKAQGAGSVKRDCSIWEDFLYESGIHYLKVPPQKGMTKWDARFFKQMTGWKERTSNHARDAAVLVFGRN